MDRKGTRDADGLELEGQVLVLRVGGRRPARRLVGWLVGQDVFRVVIRAHRRVRVDVIT